MTIPTPEPPQRVKKTPEGVSSIAIQTETCRITAPNGGAYWIQNGHLYDDSGVRIDELPDWFDGEFAKLTPAMQAKMNMQPKLNAPASMDTLGLPGLADNSGGGTQRTTKSIDAPDMADGKPTNRIEEESKLGKPVGPDLTAQPDPVTETGRPPRDANASIPSDPKQAAEDEEFLKQNPSAKASHQTPPRNPAAPVGEDLRSLNKADLVEVAKKEGVEVNFNDTKDMVANKILAHREGL